MQNTMVMEKEPLIAIDDLATHKEKRLTWKLLMMVIVVNLIVLVSIVLGT